MSTKTFLSYKKEYHFDDLFGRIYSWGAGAEGLAIYSGFTSEFLRIVFFFDRLSGISLIYLVEVFFFVALPLYRTLV